MKLKHVILLFIFLSPALAIGQPKVFLNAWAEAELSHASEVSDFYFNEISRNHTGWSARMNNINALVTTKINSKFSVNLRAQIDRESGDVFNQVTLPLLNVKYKNSKKDFSLSLGRFITPFGAFSSMQHPKERTFINLPLSYSYYINVSSAIGFNNMIGQDSFLINDNIDWGSTMIYYGAYSDGLLLDWNIKPDKVNLQFAITNHAPNIFNRNKIRLRNYGLSSRIKLQPKYFWEQGFSISHGSFFNKMYGDVEFDDLGLAQTLVGTDFKLGFGFWELTGELMAGFYSVPEFSFPEMQVSQDNVSLNSYAGYLNLKYEVPLLSGLYVAYGIDFISFSPFEIPGMTDSKNWDENTHRHQFGLGYKITDFLLLRSNLAIQPFRDRSVPDYEDKNLNTWRTSITVFL